MENSENSEVRAADFNICARLAVWLTAFSAGTFIIIAVAQVCSFHLRELMPPPMEWTWLIAAYGGLFAMARYIGASTRYPRPGDKPSIFSAETERFFRRHESYFGTMMVLAFAVLTAIAAGLLAPSRFSYAASFLVWIPVFLGLFIGDSRGFYRMRLAKRDVVL